MDLDVVAAVLLPCLARQQQANLPHRGASRCLNVDAILHITKRSRYPERRGIVFKGGAQGTIRADAGERKMKHGGSHFLADSATLVDLPQPGASGYLAPDGEIGRQQILRTDNAAVLPNHEYQVPVARSPACPQSPPVLQRIPRTLLRGSIGPRNIEWHHGSVVDAFGGHQVQGAKILIPRISHRQSRRFDSQPEQWPVSLERHA